MSGVRVLTLHQPWASLVALGVKTVETRSWPAPQSAVGERLLIHAGARRVHTGKFLLAARDARRKGLLTAEQERSFRALDVPFGAVVASATLTACLPMLSVVDVEAHPGPWLEVGVDGRYLSYWEPGAPVARRMDDQLPFGDYRAGRWAWMLEDVKPTTERCPWCWGEGWVPAPPEHGTVLYPCLVCSDEDGDPEGLDAGCCDPVPARGRQGLWRWVQ